MARTAIGEIVDLGIGQAEDALLPRTELAEAARRGLLAGDGSCMQYGPEEGPEGFRESLAAFLRRHQDPGVTAADLVVTAGASHGLDLLLSRLTRPGDTVFVEDPSYFFALDVLEGRGLRLIGVSMDEDGLDVAALERMLEVERPVLLYTVPVFHNPTGVTLRPDRRQRLVELARRYDFLIVADEVYQLLGSTTPPPMRTLDRDRVLSLGSFSKILGPGIRLGWVEAPWQLWTVLRDCPVLRSGGGVSPVGTAVMREVLDSGMQDEVLLRLTALYDHRRAVLTEALETSLPDDVHFRRPDGGYYAWLELPPDVDAEALATIAPASGVAFRPGRVFSIAGRQRNRLRVCFTYYDDDALRRGGDRLGALLTEHLRGRREAQP
jgi:DNA-binding transcriptional MocR family regulator